ncbi:MAG: peptidoglycan DD-metalloendopeptidase family protein [Bacteroidales bacterium]
MRKLFGIGIIVCFIGPVLWGQTKEELERQKQKAFDEIKLARELMEQTETRRESSIQRLSILQQGINSRARLIRTLENEVTLLEEDIAASQEQIRRLEAQNRKNRDEYARLIYYAYRNHTNYEKLMYILAGKTISQAYQRYKYMKYIANYRKQKAGEIEELIREVAEKKSELDELREEKLKLLEEKESEQGQLVREREQRTSMVRELNQEERKLKREIEEKERIANELEAEIRKIIEEEARRLSEGSTYGALTPEQELVGNDFRRNKGKLPWPVDRGMITAGFGNNEYPGLVGSNYNNNGVDINSTPGTKVRAVFEGEVTKVFAILGANYTVLIRHGEYVSVYHNLVNVRVKTGDKVLTKEVLGEAFTDEGNQIATVHFEVWQERDMLNPEEWLSK